jgi:MinD-like ATPase involved in chromosome partitioning or flagellar assembly
VRVDGTGDDRQVGTDMASACRRFFGIRLTLLGCLPHDDAVRRSVRVRIPVLFSEPDAAVSASVRRVAHDLLALVANEERAA